MSALRSRRLMAVGRTLAVDAATDELVRALSEAGVESLLLRGPAVRRGIYGGATARTYTDCDLLVPPASVEAAAAVLERLGYRLKLDHAEHASVAEPHAQEWRRGRDEHVDLHWRVAGAEAPPEHAWRVLSAHAEPLPVGHGEVRGLAGAALAVVVALHAAHHGTTAARPLRDLETAVARLERPVWEQAARLSGELRASEAFAAGLRLCAAGAAVADSLGLASGMSARRRLMASDQPAGSLGVLRVLEARGGRARALRETLLPAPSYMRASYPRARGGRAALARAYAARLAARAWALPGAVRAVHAARAASRDA